MELTAAVALKVISRIQPEPAARRRRA